MGSDWLFDAGAVRQVLDRLTVRAENALASAREALERADADRLAECDARALAGALEAVAEARERLRSFDADWLDEAHSLLQDVLDRSGRPVAEPVRQHA